MPLPLHVLVVDEDSARRDAVTRAFGDAGHVVAEARDAGEALLGVAAHPPPDVVVALGDVGLPGSAALGRLAGIGPRAGRPGGALPVVRVGGPGDFSAVWCRADPAEHRLPPDAPLSALVSAAQRLGHEHRLPPEAPLSALVSATQQLGHEHRPPAPPPRLLRADESAVRRLARATHDQLLESAIRSAIADLGGRGHGPDALVLAFFDLVRDAVWPGALLVACPAEGGLVAVGVTGPAAGPDTQTALELALAVEATTERPVWFERPVPATREPVERRGAHAREPLVHSVHALGLCGQSLSGVVAVALPASCAQRHGGLLHAAFEELGRVLQLERAHVQVQALTTRDALTGLLNRRRVLELLDYEMERSLRTRLALSVILADVDHLTAVNDRFGRPVGDEVLRQLGQRMTSRLRRVDALGRLGGQEFLMVCPDTAITGARVLAEDVRVLVEREPVAGAPVTVSLGVAQFDPMRDDRDTLLARADQLRQASKSASRAGAAA